jgi:hypothetical protein
MAAGGYGDEGVVEGLGRGSCVFDGQWRCLGMSRDMCEFQRNPGASRGKAIRTGVMVLRASGLMWVQQVLLYMMYMMLRSAFAI